MTEKYNILNKSQLIISIVSQLIMIISQSLMTRITINVDKNNEETTFRMTMINKKVKRIEQKSSSSVFIKDLILLFFLIRTRTRLAEFFVSSFPFFQGYRGMCQGGRREEENRVVKRV